MLTIRENDVMREVARGKTNQQIADILFISVNTIESHIRSIFVKFGVKNRTQATLKFINENH